MHSADRPGRRRRALRRLFLFAGLMLLASGAPSAAHVHGQDDLGTRIVKRQARITRDPSGRYRFIESLLVTVGDSAGRPARGTPLRLVRLGAVEDVRGLGGDIEPRQIVYDPPYLTVVDSIGPGDFQVAFTYVVSEGVTAVEMAAAAPLTELVLEVQRGSVTARPDPRFRPDGVGGPPARPYRRYVARQLPLDAALSVEFVERRVDWRQRLAVSLGTAIAVAIAGIWVWRRDTARRATDSSTVAGGATRP